MKKKCAVCGDTHQTNIIYKWQRNSDGTVFHICGLCAEAGKVNAESVHTEVSPTYTTVDSEFAKSTPDGTLKRRPAFPEGRKSTFLEPHRGRFAKKA